MLCVADVLLIPLGCTIFSDLNLIIGILANTMLVIEEQGLRAGCGWHHKSLTSLVGFASLTKNCCGSLYRSLHVFVIGGCCWSLQMATRSITRLSLLMLSRKLSNLELPLLVLAQQVRLVCLMKKGFCKELGMSNFKGVLIVTVGV